MRIQPGYPHRQKLTPGELLRNLPAGTAAVSDPIVDVRALGIHSLHYRRKGVRQPLVGLWPHGRWAATRSIIAARALGSHPLDGRREGINQLALGLPEPVLTKIVAPNRHHTDRP